MVLQHRATCPCGWVSEWLDHRYQAHARVEVHNDSCDLAAATAESLHDYEVEDDRENPRATGVRA